MGCVVDADGQVMGCVVDVDSQVMGWVVDVGGKLRFMGCVLMLMAKFGDVLLMLVCA